MEDMDEQAKAVQEVAKTVGKGIDASSRAGQFISDYIKAARPGARPVFLTE